MDDLNACMGRNPDRFNQLLAEIRAAGTDHMDHFGNGYTHEGGYGLQQNPFEFAAAIRFLEDRLVQGRSYLEIGTASGGTCRFLVEKIGFDKVWVIDDHGHGRWPEQQANFDALDELNAKYGPSDASLVQKWIGDSRTPQAAAWLERRIFSAPALSFIDGLHTYEGSWSDFVMVHKLLMARPGSHKLVMFHDTVACEGVKQSWQQAISSGMLEPLAEYIGPDYRPLGIGIGHVK